MTEPLRVLIVEDSVLLREGLTRLLDEAGYLTVGALGDAVGLEEQVALARPDVVVLDVRLPPDFRDEGLRAARALRARSPEIGVLVLSQYVETLYAAELLSAGTGGVGYLLKDRVASLDELREAIERVHIGGTVLDPQVVAAMLTARTDPLSTLTPREREVLDVMTQGAHQSGHRRAAGDRRRCGREARHVDLRQTRPAGVRRRPPPGAGGAPLPRCRAVTGRTTVRSLSRVSR